MRQIPYRRIRIAAIAIAVLMVVAAYLAGPGKRDTAAFTINGEEISGENPGPEGEPVDALTEDFSAPSGDSATGREDSSVAGPESGGADGSGEGTGRNIGGLAGTNTSGQKAGDGGAVGSAEPESRQISVYVCGKVKTPGVVTLPEGSRIVDAVKAAGGMTEEAAAEAVNLAMLLSDGVQIRIPGKEEADGSLPASGIGTSTSAGVLSGAGAVSGGAFSGGAGAQSAVPGPKININLASAEELQTLPGIGKSRAGDIIAYRSRNPFRTPEDIMKVPGIKKGAFGKIKDRITAG